MRRRRYFGPNAQMTYRREYHLEVTLAVGVLALAVGVMLIIGVETIR